MMICILTMSSTFAFPEMPALQLKNAKELAIFPPDYADRQELFHHDK